MILNMLQRPLTSATCTESCREVGCEHSEAHYNSADTCSAGHTMHDKMDGKELMAEVYTQASKQARVIKTLVLIIHHNLLEWFALDYRMCAPQIIPSLHSHMATCIKRHILHSNMSFHSLVHCHQGICTCPFSDTRCPSCLATQPPEYYCQSHMQ